MEPFSHIRVLQLASGAAGDIDYMEIVTHSGPVVMGVLLLLILSSVVCWAIILKKWLHLKRAQDASVRFLETFWQSKRLDAIYQAAENLSASPISQVFRAGYVELSKVTASQKKGGEAAMSDQLGGIENVERALKRAAAAEVTHLEATGAVPRHHRQRRALRRPLRHRVGHHAGLQRHLPDGQRQPGHGGEAHLARPSSPPPSASSAAIPAVVAYNYFVTRIRVLDSEMTNFSNDFLNIVRRHFFS